MNIVKIQKFSTHDGPGVRTAVFVKGCPLRCVWCHNPETQSARPEFFFIEKFCIGCGACRAACPAGCHRFSGGRHTVDRAACTGCLKCAAACPAGALEPCSSEMSPDEVFAEVRKDKAFYGETGGVTLSGGEPMLYPEESADLLKKCREDGIGTAVETCGWFDEALLPEIGPLTDLFLWDVKDTDAARHLANTGVSPEPILRNLRAADEMGFATRLRCILVRGVNLNAEHLRKISELCGSLKHCRGVELLPYHTYGSSKEVQLGRPDGSRREWIPAGDELRAAEEFFGERGQLIR